MWRNAQYSQRECVEISEIVASVNHKELEPTACKVQQQIGVDIIEEELNHVIVSTNLVIEQSSSFSDVRIAKK